LRISGRLYARGLSDLAAERVEGCRQNDALTAKGGLQGRLIIRWCRHRRGSGTDTPIIRTLGVSAATRRLLQDSEPRFRRDRGSSSDP
jgi:hypothetical protein